MFKLKNSVDDINIPGTLNVACTIPVSIEALMFIGTVEVELVTLIAMILASVIGASVGARIVTELNRTMIRLGMFIGLFVVGCIMILKQAGIGPFGLVGTSTGLDGVSLVIAIAVCFILGALMNLGVGMYAPCMALVLMLGMDVNIAFPVMFGSSTYLMAFGSGPKFIKEGRFDLVATLCIAIIGSLAVIVCYFTVYTALKDHVTILL